MSSVLDTGKYKTVCDIDIECNSHGDMDVDLDRRFLQDLRDFKPLLEKEVQDEHKR